MGAIAIGLDYTSIGIVVKLIAINSDRVSIGIVIKLIAISLDRVSMNTSSNQLQSAWVMYQWTWTVVSMVGSTVGLTGQFHLAVLGYWPQQSV